VLQELPMDMPDPLLLDLLEQISVAAVAITTRALSEASPGFDLTFPQWRSLLVVGEHVDGARLSDVAGRVGVTLPATSRHLQRLARRGLVEIGPDLLDRRASRVRLTPHGAAVRFRLVEFRRELLATSIASLSVSDETLRELAAVAASLAASG
jgi:DNA-binding MarR family transcriptional regulator